MAKSAAFKVFMNIIIGNGLCNLVHTMVYIIIFITTSNSDSETKANYLQYLNKLNNYSC